MNVGFDPEIAAAPPMAPLIPAAETTFCERVHQTYQRTRDQLLEMDTTIDHAIHNLYEIIPCVGLAVGFCYLPTHIRFLERQFERNRGLRAGYLCMMPVVMSIFVLSSAIILRGQSTPTTIE